MNLDTPGISFCLVVDLASIQVWDWLFKSCEINGRMLIREGLIDVKDIGECIVKGKCKKLGIKLPAWSILDCLLASAKSNSSGLVICMLSLERLLLPVCFIYGKQKILMFM
mgnify:CR=1 FL=1